MSVQGGQQTSVAKNGGSYRMPGPAPAPGAVRTPHSGYHFDGRPERFFEGWYFKVNEHAAAMSTVIHAS
eukprot:scaffold465453_cov37-Prasinocladus_malaysianus.AAC.1